MFKIENIVLKFPSDHCHWSHYYMVMQPVKYYILLYGYAASEILYIIIWLCSQWNIIYYYMVMQPVKWLCSQVATIVAIRWCISIKTF